MILALAVQSFIVMMLAFGAYKLLQRKAMGEIVINDKRVRVPFVTNVSKINLLTTKPRPSNIAINGVIVHHTATQNPNSTFAVLKDKGLSTHFEIDKTGVVWQYADPVKSIAYHAGDQNSYKIGIDLTGPKFTPIQLDVLKDLIFVLAKEIGFPVVIYDWNQKGFPPTQPGVIAHAQTSSGVAAGKIDPSDIWDEIVKRIS